MNFAKFLLGIFIPILLKGEYRVYQFFIEKKSDKTKKLTTSSLDPQSYFAYHGQSHPPSYTLIRTWICPGHTGNKKKYCDSPYKSLIEQETKQGYILRIPKDNYQTISKNLKKIEQKQIEKKRKDIDLIKQNYKHIEQYSRIY